MQTNTDLPNTYRRSTTETIMHPIGQNILLTYPHFGIDFLQPPRFLNSENSETVKLGHLFSFQMVNVQYLQQEKYISSLPPGRYPYRNSYLLHLVSICRFKIYTGKLRTLMTLYRLLLLLLLFLTFSVLVANPKKLLYTVANPARGLLNREKRTKEKVWQHTPPPTPHTARSEKINKITRRIYRRYAGGRSRVRTRIPSARRLGLWVWLRNSTLPSAIIRFPVSLLLSSPGDV